jgi:hypothetical protein
MLRQNSTAMCKDLKLYVHPGGISNPRLYVLEADAMTTIQRHRGLHMDNSLPSSYKFVSQKKVIPIGAKNI